MRHPTSNKEFKDSAELINQDRQKLTTELDDLRTRYNHLHEDREKLIATYNEVLEYRRQLIKTYNQVKATAEGLDRINASQKYQRDAVIVSRLNNGHLLGTRCLVHASRSSFSHEPTMCPAENSECPDFFVMSAAPM